MTMREQVLAEIEKVPEEKLDEVYSILKRYTKLRSQASQQSPLSGRPSILKQLMEIQIEGPPDFAENIDQYVSGEKRAEPGVP
jgi:hypothetical protein